MYVNNRPIGENSPNLVTLTEDADYGWKFANEALAKRSINMSG
jgi:hypothetical protein